MVETFFSWRFFAARAPVLHRVASRDDVEPLQAAADRGGAAGDQGPRLQLFRFFSLQKNR